MYRVGVLILLLLAFMIIVPFSLFPLNITIGAFTFTLACALTLLTYFRLYGIDKASVRNVYLAAIVVVLAVAASNHILDLSYDGIAYQKAAVGALKNGWNPFTESVGDWTRNQPIRSGADSFSLWVDHYPKAAWYIGAGFYAVTGTIESAKAYTLLMMVACFGIVANFLTTWGLTSRQARLAALAAVVNPITVAQFSTFYNDAFLMLALFAVIVFLVRLFYQRTPETFMLLFMALTICANIKFTGLVYAFVFSLFHLLLLVRWMAKRKESLGGLILIAALICSGTIFFALLGGPYLKNMQGYGSPFYPILGADSVDIIAGNEPASFEGRSTAFKAFYSIFSYSEDLGDAGIADPRLRVPFTLAKDELHTMSVPDLRIGGFGPFFGPMLLACAVVAAVGIGKLRKTDPMTASILLLNAALAVLLILGISESWWARYSGYLYGVVPVALILWFRLWGGAGRKLHLLAALAFCLLALVNAALFFPTERIRKTPGYVYELDTIRSQSIEVPVTIYAGKNEVQFTGLLDNLMDKGVWFYFSDKKEDDMAPALDGKIYYRKNVF